MIVDTSLIKITFAMSSINLLVVAVILLNLYLIKARNLCEQFSLNHDLLQISSRIKRQTEDQCLLPNHPANGELKILEYNEQSDYLPNSPVVARTIIDLSCKEGYSTKTGGLARAICHRGVWTPAISKMGGCTRTCVSVKTETDSYTVKCVYGNDEVSCKNPKEGTRADVHCKTLFEYTAHRPIIKCKDGSWNNDISPCTPQPQPVTLSVTTQTKGTCILPPHPPNGKFKVLGGAKDYFYEPNTPIPEFTVITLECTNSYVPESDNPSATCSSGEWLPDSPIRGGCIHMYAFYEGTCPSIKSDTDSYTVKCVHNYTQTSCKNPKEGTRAFVYCKTFFEYNTSRPLIECKNGSWNYEIIPCSSECGRKRVGAQTLTVGGGHALKNEYPWLTGIYYRSNSTHLCEGSIISRYYVLSAAHCFTTSRGVLFDKNEYVVAAGKYYRNLDDKRDQDLQVVKIEKIYISEDYKGIIQNYGFDYAVLKLQQPFKLSSAVQPVCVDWNNKYETTDFTENNTGVVASWGFTQEGSDPAGELKIFTVPYRQISTCIQFMPTDFVEKYFSFDKFCAGLINKKTNVCNGNSGGGLYFKSFENRYFIRGIVTFAPTGCDSNQFALYTKVSRHLDEIRKITGREV